MDSNIAKINFIGRLGLAFVFFYHGLIPKILWLSPVETQIVLAHEFNVSAHLISITGGILEILLAITIILYRHSLVPIYLAGILLIALLIDITLVIPELLTEAFNPVSINLACLTLCYLVFLSQEKQTDEYH